MGAEQNKAVVAGAYEAFGRGDLNGLFAALSQDVVWTSHVTGSPIAGVHKGLDGVGGFFTMLDESAEITRFDIETLVADGDIVVALGTIGFTAKGSGRSTEGPLVHVLHLEDGKVTTFDAFEDVDQGVW